MTARKLIIALFLAIWIVPISFAKSGKEALGDYLLGPGDVVKIQVYDHEDLTTEAQLNNDGLLTFPLLGEVKLGGLAYTEAEALVAKKLAAGGFIKKPNVNVLITQYRSQRVAVLGEINKPGRYALDSNTDLIDLVAIAGGVGPSGGDVIVILRGEERYEYRLSKLTQLANSEKRSIPVQSGDTVYVPRAELVYVFGEVNRPGSFRLEPKMTVMQALATAGGYNQRASSKGILIHRVIDGEVKEIPAKPIDLLQAGDTVYIKESFF
ncbi:SLBB domain-containing protein [Chitinibacter tainanensis]|uniref:SLBB domain-containing protein n=1 Tax=Chitinibacter tainanensis TaxID=230667 RepID=UPI0023561DFE|nr:SLBB domain-containing protein [Chitinibacter tainanensis]